MIIVIIIFNIILLSPWSPVYDYYNIILLSPCSPAVLFCQDYDHHAWMLFECIFNYVWLSTFLIITVFNELFIRLSPLYLRSPRTDRAQHFFLFSFLFFSYFFSPRTDRAQHFFLFIFFFFKNFHLALIEPSTEQADVGEMDWAIVWSGKSFIYFQFIALHWLVDWLIGCEACSL